MMFGDLLRYPYEADPEGEFLFMFVGRRDDNLNNVMVLRPHDDDVWAVGEVIVAGVHELKRAEEVPDVDR